MRTVLKTILISILFLFPVSSPAQEVTKILSEIRKIKDNDPVNISGSFSNNLNYTNGTEGLNFLSVTNASLNIRFINKLSVPLTMSITKGKTNFTHGFDKYSRPFDHFGMSPSYRFLTIHAGYRVYNLSEFSLTGAMIKGGGIEIKPEEFPFMMSVFYGQMVKASPVSNNNILVNIPAFERRGLGIKTTIGKKENNITAVYFKAGDREESIRLDSGLSLTPMENQILGLMAEQKFKNFSSAQEITFSMFTENLFNQEKKVEKFTYINHIFSPGSSSHFNYAYCFQAGYEFNILKAGIKFRQIDPGYKSLGAMFIVNDIREIAGEISTQLLKKTIRMDVSAGTQENNLDRKLGSKNRRLVSACRIGWTPGEKFSLNLNYSGFSSNTIPMNDLFYDTIRFAQVNRNFGTSFNFSFGNSKVSHVINGNFNYQETANNGINITFFNCNTGYDLRINNKDLSLNTGSQINGSFDREQKFMAGPFVSLRKSMAGKKISFFINYTALKELNARNQNSQGVSAGINASLLKNFSVRIDASAVKRNSSLKTDNNKRISFSAQYNFGLGWKQMKDKIKK